LRDPLFAAYNEIVRNYYEERWEPSELNGGKLCEIIYCIIDSTTSATAAYPAGPRKPTSLVDACRVIEQRPIDANRVGDRSLRILIPRALVYLYEIRNNRNVGHVGGDVNPNYSDATAVCTCASWLMAELIRIYHGVPLSEAQGWVDSIVERKIPLVWECEGIKRVLDPKMKYADQVLVLLYSSVQWVAEDKLREWIGDNNKTRFRDRYLVPLHDERLLEYDCKLSRARITPLGSKDVDSRLLKTF